MRLVCAILLGVCAFVAVLEGQGSASVASNNNPVEEELRSAIRDFVAKRVSIPYDSLSVTVEVPHITYAKREVRNFSVDLYTTSKAVVGTVPVRVDLDLADGRSVTLAATTRVRVFSDVVVASRRLGRHKRLSPEDLRFERREVTSLRDAYFVNPDDVVGKRTRRIIAGGSLILASDVEEVPLVTRGTGVAISVVVGAVTVTSRGTALEDGDLGETIAVKDVTTGKRLYGRIVGERVVVIDVSQL